MKTVTTQAFQGDVMFRKRATAIPAEASKAPEGKEIVVAHSETGHHHVAEGAGLQFFTSQDPRIMFLRVEDHADIVHKRDYHTHETIRLDKGDWDIVRQREGDALNWTTVAD